MGIPFLGTLLVSTSFLAACGNAINTDVRGTLGITWTEHNHLEVIVQPCGLKIDRMVIGGDRGSGGDIRSSEPLDEQFVVDLSDIDQSWEIVDEVTLSRDHDETLSFIAAKNKADEQVRGVVTMWSDIESLREGEVLIGESIDVDGNKQEPTIVNRQYFSRCAE